MVVDGRRKAPRDCSEGAMWGDVWAHAGLATITVVDAGDQCRAMDGGMRATA